MTLLWSGLIGGLLGSAHCVGMCGGFAVTLGSSPLPWRPIIVRQLAYTMGRVFTYCVLGAVAAGVGLRAGTLPAGVVSLQQVFAFVAGLLMVVVGLSTLGLIRWRLRDPLGLTRVIGPLFAQCLNARTLPGFFGAGLANGFLPCGLVYAFLALAVSRADVVDGMVLMVGFGLGTAPAMLALGCGTRWMNRTLRAHLMKAAAVVVLVFGGVTLARAAQHPAAHCCQDDVPRAVVGE